MEENIIFSPDNYKKILGQLIRDIYPYNIRVTLRKEYVKDLPSWIEVNADSETDDGSLRLPIFQRVRIDK